jgi:uncharacterized protein (TIGR00369 family)
MDATFDSRIDYKPLIKTLDTFCFGCSPTNPSGLQMKFFTGGDSVISRLNIPLHLCGWKNIVHGGILATILDETMSWSTIHLLKRVVLTTSITVDYIKPVFAGTDIVSQGKVLERTSEREAIMQAAIYNGEGDLCVKSRGIFRLFTPDAARKLKLMSEDILSDFEQFIRFKPE